MTVHDAAKRGAEDARKGRPCLFRKVRSTFEAEIDDSQSDYWTQEDRAAYWESYHDSIPLGD